MDTLVGSIGSGPGANSFAMPEPMAPITNVVTKLGNGDFMGAAMDGLEMLQSGATGSGSWNASQGDGVDPADAKTRAADDFQKLQNGIKPEGMDERQFRVLMLQQEVDANSRMITLMTNLLKTHSETLKNIVQNIRA